MHVFTRRTLQVALVVGTVVLAGCGMKKIKSDLVLESWDIARIDLHQKTEAIELYNDSDATVNVKVYGRKDREMQNMQLDPHERVRLDLASARWLRFENEYPEDAVIRWTLLNHKAMEYTMAINP